MRNEFLNHEDDFQFWVESGFFGARDTTLDYLKFLADEDDYRRPKPDGLWPHQWDALLRVIYSREVAPRSLWQDGVLLNIVTGGGKTALIAATMVWLRISHDVQRFLILCPNLIVRDRLDTDFLAGKVFVDRNLIPPGSIVSHNDFALTTLGGESNSLPVDLFGSNVVLANIHQFYLNSQTGQRNFWAFLQANQTPFAIFNDEAHNTPAPQYDRTLTEFGEHASYAFRLDTTATPERADDTPLDSRMIYEFDIPAALNSRVIAQPVVYQPDIASVELTYTDPDTGEHRRVEEIDWDEVDRAGLNATQWVTDSEPMSQQISIALNRLDEAKRMANGRYQPILFVVAVSKQDARNAAQMLKQQFRLRTLIVTEDEEEEARKEAAAIGQSGQYDAVVSVAMLREGWDVPEVSVILLLRKFGSKVYGPQVVGRGLRRVRRPGMDDDEPQICAVVDHPKLEHEWLWELLRARVRSEVGIDQKFDETEERGDPPPSQRVVNHEMLITIPEPEDEPIEPPVPPVRPPSKGPARDWMQLLEGFEYEAVEITHVELSGVIGRELGEDGWENFKSAPTEHGGIEIAKLSTEELRENLREWMGRTAEQAVEIAGFGRQQRRHVENGLRQYLCVHFLDGESITYADENALRRATRSLNQLEILLMRRPDIIGGMIEYARD